MTRHENRAGFGGHAGGGGQAALRYSLTRLPRTRIRRRSRAQVSNTTRHQSIMLDRPDPATAPSETQQRLRKSFGGEAVLHHVDLAIERGSVFALLGPNGAGKTTMVRILATLLRPDAGTAVVAGCRAPTQNSASVVGPTWPKASASPKRHACPVALNIDLQPESFTGLAGLTRVIDNGLFDQGFLSVGRVGARRPRRGAGSTARWVLSRSQRRGVDGQVTAGSALTLLQAPRTASIQGQSARRCSQRFRWPRVSRAGRSNSRNRSSLTEGPGKTPPHSPNRCGRAECVVWPGEADQATASRTPAEDAAESVGRQPPSPPDLQPPSADWPEWPPATPQAPTASAGARPARPPVAAWPRSDCPPRQDQLLPAPSTRTVPSSSPPVGCGRCIEEDEVGVATHLAGIGDQQRDQIDVLIQSRIGLPRQRQAHRSGPRDRSDGRVRSPC